MYWKSNIYFDGYRLIGKNPLTVYGLALELREKGHAIGLARQEARKAAAVQSGRNAQVQIGSVNALYETFTPDPFAFEEFVGKVFSHQGYRVERTPRTNDGGIDLVLHQGQRKLVVECKCYEPNSSVGRPVIQKLVGSGMGFGANGAVVVTTAKFSLGAKEYAEQMRVSLVDGVGLLQMAQQAGLVGRGQAIHAPGQPDWMLSKLDLLARVPDDLLSREYGLKRTGSRARTR